MDAVLAFTRRARERNWLGRHLFPAARSAQVLSFRIPSFLPPVFFMRVLHCEERASDAMPATTHALYSVLYAYIDAGFPEILTFPQLGSPVAVDVLVYMVLVI